LEQLKQPNEAKQLYQQVAAKRDYYSFLAADRINSPYQMENYPIQFTADEENKILKNTSVAKALEFYAIGMNTIGRKEWQYAVNQMGPRQQEIAAVLASRKGWHDRAIITAAKAGSYDDLTVRFPLPYRPQLMTGAETQDLDLAWVYGIVRQESAFMADVKSHAGALGLMQLMPSTGRYVAKKIGISVNNNQDFRN
jgi:soluble lytic murein transglycosylase